MLFIRGRSVAPDSSEAATGVSKSTKTILNKISNPDIFFFMHSKTFFDFLRKDGSDAVTKFMRNEIKFKLKMMAALKSKVHSKVEKKNEKGMHEKLSVKNNRMKEDKIFLKNLEKSLVSLKSPVPANQNIRSYIFKAFEKCTYTRSFYFRANVMKTIIQASQYLDAREIFWNQID